MMRNTEVIHAAFIVTALLVAGGAAAQDSACERCPAESKKELCVLGDAVTLDQIGKRVERAQAALDKAQEDLANAVAAVAAATTAQEKAVTKKESPAATTQAVVDATTRKVQAQQARDDATIVLECVNDLNEKANREYDEARMWGFGIRLTARGGYSAGDVTDRGLGAGIVVQQPTSPYAITAQLAVDQMRGLNAFDARLDSRETYVALRGEAAFGRGGVAFVTGGGLGTSWTETSKGPVVTARIGLRFTGNRDLGCNSMTFPFDGMVFMEPWFFPGTDRALPAQVVFGLELGAALGWGRIASGEAASHAERSLARGHVECVQRPKEQPQ